MGGANRKAPTVNDTADMFWPCVIVLGSTGRLGQALVQQLTTKEQPVVLPSRQTYESWGEPDGYYKARQFIRTAAPRHSLLLNAAGLIDPREPLDAHLKANTRLAINAAHAITDHHGMSISFGSALERLLPRETMNSYILSKWRLGHWADGAAAIGLPVLHLQMHTLYGGGPPSPFMFLGQILAAIRDKVPFKMTSGLQLREYHHVEDEAHAIRHLAGLGFRGSVPLSHHKPVSLRQLSEAIFTAFDCENLLRIGALPTPPGENYGYVFDRLAQIEGSSFRDTISSVISWFESQLTPTQLTRVR